MVCRTCTWTAVSPVDLQACPVCGDPLGGTADPARPRCGSWLDLVLILVAVFGAGGVASALYAGSGVERIDEARKACEVQLQECRDDDASMQPRRVGGS